MFTGIVEELGEIVAVDRSADSARLAIRGPLATSDAAAGDSIAVNGVCLTVVGIDADVFTVDVIGETLRRSSLATAAPGDRVNLERAAALGDRLGGHLVQGHVDGTGTLLERARASGDGGDADWELLRFGYPRHLSRYLVEKGSITVDGVSLTVVHAGTDEFSIGLIPTTRALTTLGHRQPGDAVNIEVDVLAKYVERLAGPHLPATGGDLRDDAGEEVR